MFAEQSEHPITHEEHLYVSELFVRQRFHSDGVIDYPTEMRSLLFLEHCCVFLYDNQLYRYSFNNRSFNVPELLTQRHVVSVCVVNPSLNQLLVVWEESGDLAFLVIDQDTPSPLPSVHVEKLPSPCSKDLLKSFNQWRSAPLQESLLQNNCTLTLRYFPQCSLVVIACKETIEDSIFSNGTDHDSVRRITSKVLEIVVNDEDGDDCPETERSLLEARSVLEIETQYLHEQTHFSVWTGLNTESQKETVFVATVWQDTVVRMWAAPLSTHSLDNAQAKTQCEQSNTIERENMKENALSRDSQSFSNDEKSYELPRSATSADWNSRGASERDPQGEQENQTTASAEREISSSAADAHTQRPAGRHSLLALYTQHKAWISSLSQSLTLRQSPSPTQPCNGSIPQFAATGDQEGAIALYYFSLSTTDNEHDDEEEEGREDSPKRAPWRQCDLWRGASTAAAVTELLLCPQFSLNASRLFAGSAAGGVTVLSVSHKSYKMHALQELSLFSAVGAVTCLSVSLLAERATQTQGEEESCVDNLRVRCYSHDLGEAAQCSLSPNVDSMFKIWPEPLIASLSLQDTPVPRNVDRSVYRSETLVDRCCVLEEKHVLFVSDFSREIHAYDVRSGQRLLSLSAPSAHCTCLAAFPRVLSIEKPLDQRSLSLAQLSQAVDAQRKSSESDGITLVSGHQGGEVHVFHVFLGAVSNTDEESTFLMGRSDVFSQSFQAETSQRAHTESKSLHSSQPPDSEVFDLLEGTESESDAARPSRVMSRQHSAKLDLLSEEGTEESAAPSPRAEWRLVQSLRASPLQVTELFFSSSAQCIVSVHIKQFVCVHRNALHFLSLQSELQALAKAQPVEKKSARKDSKAKQDVTANKSRQAASSQPPAASASSPQWSFPACAFDTVKTMRLDQRAQSISELIATVLDDEQSVNTNATLAGSGNDRERRSEPPKERLVLVLAGPQQGVIRLFNAIDCVFLLDLPLPNIPYNAVNNTALAVTTNVAQSRVRSALIWDHPIAGSDERALIGLCPTTTADQYLVFNETAGFQLVQDHEHLHLLSVQAQDHKRFALNVLQDSWQRQYLVGAQGFSSSASPIVTVWSNYHCILLRVQLHADRGVLVMRSKHCFTHLDPEAHNMQDSSCPRILLAKPLKRFSNNRNHRVLLVLSNGFTIVLHL